MVATAEADDETIRVNVWDVALVLSEVSERLRAMGEDRYLTDLGRACHRLQTAVNEAL